jgi:Tol biopolymer transport system component
MDEEGVWEIKAADNAKPEKLSVGTSMNDMTYSAVAHRLVYSRAGYDWNIWRMRLRDPGPERRPKPFISSTVLEENPQYSPDGKKIAFESNASGLMEIWLCDADGSNPTQLTKFAGSPVGTPRWSPDGQWIAFDHNEGGFWGIYVVRAQGGAPRRVTPAPSKRQETYEAPSWSRDGKWIYYGSNQTGHFEVWKLPFAGGTPVQVTRQGGFVAFESSHGSRLYYTKGEGGGIFEMTLADGKEVKVVNAIFSRSFTVTDGAVYFVPFANAGKIVIKALDLATRKIRDVGPISAKPLEGMSVSPDGEFLLYTQQDSSGSDLIAVENIQ